VCTPESRVRAVLSAGPVSSPTLAWGLAPVLGARPFGVEEGAGAVSVPRGKSKRVWEEEVVEWERAVTAGKARDVMAGMPKRGELKSKGSQASLMLLLWDGLLNSDTLLSVTILRGILTKKHHFVMKGWNWGGKRHKFWSSDNMCELEKLIITSVSQILYL